MTTEKPFATMDPYARRELLRRELQRAESFEPLPEAVWQAFDIALERLSLAIAARAQEIFGPWPVGMKVRIKTEYAARFVADWSPGRGPERLRRVVLHSWSGPPFHDDKCPVLILTPGVFWDQQDVMFPLDACEPWPGACASFVEGGPRADVCAYCGDSIDEHQLDVSGPGA